MAGRVKYGSLPFTEAIDFFRQKVNLPTEHYTDLQRGMHARAFVVAGATKDELLADFRSALDGAISKGTTLRDFRKDFNQIVKRHGWSYRGTPGWRSKVIYDTNLRTAHHAGRYKQMQAVKAARPYWQYRHGDSKNPRPEHLSWHGLVLPADDPWWQTHYVPNGWGCNCGVLALNARDLRRLGKSGPDAAPDDGTYEWKNKRTGETRRVPVGIDPGWDYNVGEAAWGRPLSEEAMAEWRARKGKAWELLTPGDFESAGRPGRIPLDPLPRELGPVLTSQAEMQSSLEAVLGGEERVFELPGRFRYPVLVNAATLARHLPLDRSPYIPLVADALTDPLEVWLAFERHRGTGWVSLSYTTIRAFDVGGGRAAVAVASARKGVMEAWTVIPTSRWGYVNNRRRGKLLRVRP